MCYQEIKKQTETGDTGQKINIYILKKTKRFFSNLFCTVTSQILLKSTTQKTFFISYLYYIQIETDLYSRFPFIYKYNKAC